jgi:hypothetical protein
LNPKIRKGLGRGPGCSADKAIMAMIALGFRALKHSRFLFDTFLSQSTVKFDSMNERAVKFLTP